MQHGPEILATIAVRQIHQLCASERFNIKIPRELRRRFPALIQKFGGYRAFNNPLKDLLYRPVPVLHAKASAAVPAIPFACRS